MDGEAAHEGSGGPVPHPSPQKRSTRGAIIAGWRLLRSSWAVLSSLPSLLLASLGALVLGALAVGVNILAWGGVEEAFDGNVFVVAAKSLPLLIVVHSLGVLSEAVIVGAARTRLAGGEAGLDDGWRLASRRMPTLIGYGILRALERALTFLLSAFKAPGRWLADLIDTAWDFATFLVVPVILFEQPQGPGTAVRRSAHLVRSRWGTQLAAQATVGLAVFLVVAPIVGLAAAVCGLAFGAVGAWAVVIAGLVVLQVVCSALSAVLSAALFRYLHTGHTSPGFDADLLAAPYRPKR